MSTHQQPTQPGTGKTTSIVFILRVLVSMGKTVLLTSCTPFRLLSSSNKTVVHVCVCECVRVLSPFLFVIVLWLDIHPIVHVMCGRQTHTRPWTIFY
jgi:hypothetical protein